MNDKEYIKLTTPTDHNLTDENWLAWEAVLISQIHASTNSITHLQNEMSATERLLWYQCKSLEKARDGLGDYNEGEPATSK